MKVAEMARYRVDVAQRQIQADDAVPRNVALFTAKAEAAGWRVRTTYARATEVLTDRQIESIAVRIRRGNGKGDEGRRDRGFAVWINGKFDNAALISGNAGTRTYGYRELIEVVEASVNTDE